MKNWYAKWFDSQEYLELYSHRDDKDAKKLIKLICDNIKLTENSKVLDLACGNGRHSILFAELGYNTTGIDLSPFLISQANLRLKNDYKENHKNLNFEINDMRAFSYPNEFDLIVNLFSSFGYFDCNSENEKVIKSASNSLKNNGYFVLDYLNPDWTRNNIVPIDIKKEDKKIFIQTRSIIKDVVQKNIFIKNGTRVVKHIEKIKLYNLNDFEKMMSRYDLEIVKVSGSYDDKEFNKDASQRMIIFARKYAA